MNIDANATISRTRCVVAITNGTHYCSEYREVIDPMEIDDGDRPFPKGGSPTKSKDVRVLTVYIFVSTGKFSLLKYFRIWSAIRKFYARILLRTFYTCTFS